MTKKTFTENQYKMTIGHKSSFLLITNRKLKVVKSNDNNNFVMSYPEYPLEDGVSVSKSPKSPWCGILDQGNLSPYFFDVSVTGAK